MKKKVLITVLLLSMLTLTACGNSDEKVNGKDSGTNSSQDVSINKDDSKSTDKQLENGIVGSVENLQIEIDGKNYKLPVKAKEFIDAGFVADSMKDNPIIGAPVEGGFEGEVNAKIFKGDFEVNTSIKNYSDKECDYQDAYVTRAAFAGWENGDPEVKLFGGLEFGKATKDEAIALYGKPDLVSRGEAMNIITVEYENFEVPGWNDYAMMELVFDLETEILSGVEITAEIAP